MKIMLNETEIEIHAPCSLQEFAALHIKAAGTFALMVNRQFVARNDYAARQLNDNDLIHVIAPMQGG
jgi:sulfur carrier protein